MIARPFILGTLLISICVTSICQVQGQTPPNPASTAALPAASPVATPPLLTDVLFKNLKARSIGPAVMGGRVSDIAIDPRNPFVFYVGLGHGGVFKTNDNGVTF
jgi:hypothetical protein